MKSSKIHRRSSLFSSINEMAINIFWIDFSSCMIFKKIKFLVNWKLSELISVLFWIHERIYPIHENSTHGKSTTINFETLFNRCINKLYLYLNLYKVTFYLNLICLLYKMSDIYLLYQCVFLSFVYKCMNAHTYVCINLCRCG